MSSPTATSSAVAAAATNGTRAASQGGVIDGLNPTHYNPKDPIPIFIIQASLIIIMCHLLHWPLSKIRQPRVIAEVIGGIVLGPSVMGHIPGFRDAIFPPASIPNLTLVANLGLVLYLFLIGLETDVGFLVRNWRIATSVAIGGLALPFGLGCALAWGVYHQFSNDEGILHIDFSTYMLFIGIAIAITAFPVLCRILTELKLLETPVGVIVLSAGVANDVVGWILLALCVALVNSGSGLTALWILLSCVGYMAFLLYAVKPCLLWVLRRTGSIENGPSQSVIALILLVALASAFFTSIIGVHAIFGGFMVGLILPREGGFSIKVTEKLEDLIGAIFLPLYFTLSGLNTNLGLLDSGLAWAYVFAVTFLAFFSKLIGATATARLNGLVWRESFTIGVLMSCKGLVELVVLNIGLQARILSTRTFTIFVVMALLTTFATTPLTSLLYPPSYQKKLNAWKRGEIDWDTGLPIPGHGSPSSDTAAPGSSNDRFRRVLVYLRLDGVPSILTLVSLFGIPLASEPHSHPADREKRLSDSDSPGPNPTDGARAVRAHGMRLLQLTDRDSSVMTVSRVDEFGRYDPVVNIFRMVAQVSKVAVSGEVAVMPETRFGEALLSKSSHMASDLVLVPWSETGSLGDAQVISSETANDKLSPYYSNFVKSLLQSPEHNFAVLFSNTNNAPGDSQGPDRPTLTRAFSVSDVKSDIPIIPVTNKSHHIFFPYFGDSDDKLALMLVLQLCEKPDVTATVMRVSAGGSGSSSSSQDDYFTTALARVSGEVKSRVKSESAPGTTTLEDMMSHATTEFQAESRGTTWYNLLVLGRRAGKRPAFGKISHRLSDEISECLGVAAAHFIACGVEADMLVIQSRTKGA